MQKPPLVQKPARALLHGANDCLSTQDAIPKDIVPASSLRRGSGGDSTTIVSKPDLLSVLFWHFPLAEGLAPIAPAQLILKV